MTIQCRSNDGVYYPSHEENPRMGCCARCCEIVNAGRHARYVSRIQADLAHEETWEREIGERTRRGNDLRADLEMERLRLRESMETRNA